MEKKHMAIVLAIIAGLLFGAFVSAAVQQPKESECEKTEEAVVQKSNVSGALACFKPGVIDVNLTDRVEEGSDLQCVCRQSVNGNVRIFAINKASP